VEELREDEEVRGRIRGVFGARPASPVLRSRAARLRSVQVLFGNLDREEASLFDGLLRASVGSTNGTSLGASFYQPSSCENCFSASRA
jgi:hypothetical protein